VAIKTGRENSNAQVQVDTSVCTNCGLCAQICKGAPLEMVDGKLAINQQRFFGCIGCGHCMCVCPHDCIKITGRDLSYEDLIPLPAEDKRADYDQLLSLLRSRRSVRNFKNQPVEPELIAKIVEAVSTAPMGLPPSDVEILVLDSRPKVKEFADDIIQTMKGSKWFFSPLMTRMGQLVWGKEYVESVQTFIRPAIDIFIEERAKGNDFLLYDAPLAMYFHCSPYADPADPLIAATYAMLAAESMGLGSCMIGTPAYFIKYNKKLKLKYDLPYKNQPGIVVIFGHPKIKFHSAINRRLANVTFR
jgi:nitroreductase/Pyruvate/2-oxoacid:ferredoxin oxidoreductase delta subunit